MIAQLTDFIFASTLAKLALYLIGFVCLRSLAERVVRTSSKLHWPQEKRIKVIGYIRSFGLPGFLVFVVLVLANELHSFAATFSLSVAIVITLKELILCVHGYVLLLFNALYRLGDRIEIDKWRGDVVNINVLTTTIMEVGSRGSGHQRTGRQIGFPNSMLLIHFVANESFVDNFALLTLRIPLKSGADWARARAALLEIAHAECGPFLDKARRRAQERAHRQSVDVPTADPQVFLHLDEPDIITLFLRIACPLHQRDRIEQAILTRFLQKISSSTPAD